MGSIISSEMTTGGASSSTEGPTGRDQVPPFHLFSSLKPERRSVTMLLLRNGSGYCRAKLRVPNLGAIPSPSPVLFALCGLHSPWCLALSLLRALVHTQNSHLECFLLSKVCPRLRLCPTSSRKAFLISPAR